jgi:antitoxin PrlF
MVEEVKVTRNYQVTIPASARTKLGVKVGDVLVADLRDSAIVLEKKSSDIAQLRLRLDRKEKIDWRDVESAVREAGAKFGNSRRR